MNSRYMIMLMASLLLVSGCSGMDTRQKDTALGATAGVTSGLLLFTGPVGVLGATAVGALVGNQMNAE